MGSREQSDDVKLPTWAWILLGATGLYVAFKLNSWLADMGSRNPRTSWTIAAATCLPVAAVIAIESWRKNDLWMPPGRYIPFLLILWFGVFQGAYEGGVQYEHGVVADYCKYGAVSKAQLDGCRRHVRESRVDELDTNAARFGRGELDDCLADSGPYCLETLNWRLAKEQDPGPYN